MNDSNDPESVFVDRQGSRRRAVIAVGTAVGVALAGWLGLIVGSVVLVIA